MAENMMGDIITDHRERMLNLKKYYPFFKLIDTNFSQFKDGKYEVLDMGYIIMAILRFFIEENNFKEKDVTYIEYLNFTESLLKRDFGLDLTMEEAKEISDYVFDKIKNDGRPFEFSYFDPIDKKRYVSRMRIIESTIRNNTVWYSISADAVEFYLDTKEIKDESRINVSQLLLEKMINSENFRGGIEVVERINEEVNRLKQKKNEVLLILSTDVYAGIDAYEEFVETGMKWFEDEEKLFKKNQELIKKSIDRLNASSTKEKTESYYRTINEIYNLENQLKIAMNRHAELLRDCTQMQKMTDDAVRRAKLSRLRSHMDFTATLNAMIKRDNADALSILLGPLFKPNIKKTFGLNSIDEALTMKPAKYEYKEKVINEEAMDIVFEDEIEDARIKFNYIFIMNNLISVLHKKTSISLSDFNELMKKTYDENILKNVDYFSFFVNLCQKETYKIGGSEMDNETFLDGILKEGYEGSNRINIELVKQQDDMVKIGDDLEVSDILIRKVS
ncbi:hypothetical protein [Lachnospira multipara]|uniref:hypothetical protein n=1 Tax=Lachnospira multipara TaxID=28051 RepID=UPI00054D0BEB|nr:hypothetical protein [Lachnospira multipara]